MKNWQDPNAAVEAANYDNPIPSRVLILQTLLERGQATPFCYTALQNTFAT